MTEHSNHPDLLAPLRQSFDECVQADVPADARTLRGIQAALSFGLPIVAPQGSVFVTFESYSLERPRYDAIEALRRGATFAAPIKLLVRMWVASPKTAQLPGGAQEHTLFDSLVTAPNDPAVRSVYGDFLEEQGRPGDARDVRQRGVLISQYDVRDIKEQELYFGELPLMTDDGAFIVDGERRRLIVGEVDDVRSPLDGAHAPARRRVMPGDWIAHAFVLALEKLRVRVTTWLSRRDLATLETFMPHDFIDARELFRTLGSVFKRPSAAVLDERGNLVQVVEAMLSQEAVADTLVPFAEGEGTVRASGAKALRQAATLITPTVPRVQTGAEQRVAAAAGLPRAPFDAVAQRLAGDDTVLLLWPRGEPSARPPGASEVVFSFEPFARASAPFTKVVRQRDGDLVRRGEPIADEDGVRDGFFAPGREALVVFDPKARGVTISAAFGAMMTSRQLIEHDVVLRDTRGGPEGLLPHPSAPHLDEGGIVRVGARVRAGDILVGRTTWGGPDDPNRDSSFLLPGHSDDGEWVVKTVQLFRRKGRDASAREQATASTSAVRHAALIRLAEEHGGELAAQVAEFVRDAASRDGRGDDLPPGVVRFLRVVLAREVPLGVGDTLCDRRGFGGKVGRVMTAAEMPKVLGEPADVILSTMKRPHGTLLEARLTLAAKILNEAVVGPLDRALVDATCERAGLAVTGTEPKEGALYLLRRRDTLSVRRGRR